MSYVFAFGHSIFEMPDSAIEALERYFSSGTVPSTFLQAVLCNDLRAAVASANDHEAANLPAYIDWLMRGDWPSSAWGYPESVAVWSERRIQELRAYTVALKTHDWDFGMATDARAWAGGKASLERLLAMQSAVDPDLVIWNSVAPKEHRRGQATFDYEWVREEL